MCERGLFPLRENFMLTERKYFHVIPHIIRVRGDESVDEFFTRRLFILISEISSFTSSSSYFTLNSKNIIFFN